MPSQRIVQPPAVEHALEVRQSLRVGDVRHRQQPLQLISRDPKAAVDRLDGEGLGRARPTIDLERGHRLGSLTLAPLEHSPGRPEEILDAFAGGGGDGEGSAAQLDQPLAEGQHLGGLADGIHLVQANELGPAGQRDTVFLQFRAYLLVIIPELLLIAGRGIDDMDQHPSPVHVAEKFQAEPGACMRALDQPGQVCHNEAGIVGQLDDPQHRLQGGEGIIANLGPGRAGRRQERRFPGIGKTDQTGIGDQLELQPQPARFPRLAQLGEARGLPGRGLEAGVTPPAASPAANDDPLIRIHQVRDRPSLLALDEGARRNLQDEVVRVLPVAPAAAAAPTLAGDEVMLEAVILERVELPGDLDNQVAAATTVAAVGTAARHVLLAPEAQRAGAAVPRLDEDLGPVDKHRGPR